MTYLLAAIAVIVALCIVLWCRHLQDESRRRRESREMLIHVRRFRNGC